MYTRNTLRHRTGAKRSQSEGSEPRLSESSDLMREAGGPCTGEVCFPECACPTGDGDSRTIRGLAQREGPRWEDGEHHGAAPDMSIIKARTPAQLGPRPGRLLTYPRNAYKAGALPSRPLRPSPRRGRCRRDRPIHPSRRGGGPAGSARAWSRRRRLGRRRVTSVVHSDLRFLWAGARERGNARRAQWLGARKECR